MYKSSNASPAQGHNNAKTIFQAARTGDLERLAWLIEIEKADINQRDIGGETLLYLAAKFAKLDAVRYLIEYGADPSLKCKLQKAVLEIIVFEHENDPATQKDKLEYLLAQGCQFENPLFALVYERGENGLNEITQEQLLQKNSKESSLIDFPSSISQLSLLICFASSIGQVSLLKALSKKFGSATIRSQVSSSSSRRDFTPLLFAAKHGHLETVKWLLQEGGAKIHERNKNGETALLLAAKSGQLATVQWLLQEGGAKIDEKNYKGETALLLAAEHGGLKTVKWLLQEGGAKIDEKNYKGETVLLHAAKFGQLETVKWLLQEGSAKIDERNKKGATALLLAAKSGQLATVKWLLQEGGASINESNKSGETALMFAIRHDRLGIVTWLLQEGGAKIHERNKNGETALLFAVWHGRLSIVKWLLGEQGAEINERDNNGETALLLSAQRVDLEMVKWLLQEGGAKIDEKNYEGETALLLAARSGQLTNVKCLLREGGASINESNKSGETALLLAACHGHLETVKWLLREGGASIKESNNSGETALLLAAWRGHLAMVEWLLQWGGAKINEHDKFGKTALLPVLFYAARYVEKEHLSLLLRDNLKKLSGRHTTFYFNMILEQNMQPDCLLIPDYDVLKFTAQLDLKTFMILENSLEWNDFCQEIAIIGLTKLVVKNSQMLSDEQKKQLSDTIKENCSKQGLEDLKQCSLKNLTLFTLWGKPKAKLEKNAHVNEAGEFPYKFSFTNKHNTCYEFHLGLKGHEALIQGEFYQTFSGCLFEESEVKGRELDKVNCLTM